MSELRNVLYVVGSRDLAGVARAGLHIAETLTRAGWLRPLVCGPEGELVEYATATGLPVAPLASASASWRRDRTLEQAIDEADLVHAVGLEAARLVRFAGGTKNVPLVVTIDALSTRHVMRNWHRSPLSALRGHSALRFLVPGLTATSRLVHSGLVRGDQVVALPLLPFAQELHEGWPAFRAAGRERLGVAPGVQVVLGIGPAAIAPLWRGFTMTKRAGEMVMVWIDTGDSKHLGAVRGGDVMVVTPAEGRLLLHARDVLIAKGTQLAARHPAVDARWAAVPIVTTSFDAAAETVRHSVNGYVCTPAEIMPAVEAALDMAASRTLVHQLAAGRPADPVGEAVTATARCYSSILGHPLVRPILIGRQAAR